MTNNDTTAKAIATAVARRYEGLKFEPITRSADRSRNFSRTAPRTTSRRKTIR